jgi:hypothetical protein
MAGIIPNVSGMRASAAFLVSALIFGLTYGQAPLYYSNQNQYFLHGLADAGVGFLQQDWLASSADPTPAFSFLASLTHRFLHAYLFHGYYLVLFGVYCAGMVGLFTFLAGPRSSPRLRLAFFALFLLIHSALVRWASYRLLGWDYPWYFQAGLAGQYVLGAMFQPSAFGVFLILSIYLFVRGSPFWAVTSAGLAATMHATYLLSAGMLTLAFLTVLWREGQARLAVWLGLWALGLALPGVIYSLITFWPTSAAAAAEAQHLLVHVRIPHHCIPRLWCDGIALGQIAWTLLALYLVRGTRLFPVLGLVFLLSLGLTLIQVATDSDTLALLFPWRPSAILVPTATTVILSRLVVASARWLDRPAVALGSTLLGTGLVVAGLAITWFKQGFQTNDDELPLLAHVQANGAAGDCYLLPVQIPNLAATTRGSLSSDFKPLAVKKTDTRIIPVDLQRFRLSTGAPIFVDFKSVPYKDIDILEWHARLLLTRQLYEQLEAGHLDAARDTLRRHGITHVVMPAHLELKGTGVKEVYYDNTYRLYHVRP